MYFLEEQAVELSVIKVLAGLLIVLAMVKLIIVLVSPKVWVRFMKRVYAVPFLTSMVALILAALVLYLLLQSGLSIVQVLAVTVFVSLLLVAGGAPFSKQLIDWLETQSLTTILRAQWVYVVVWVGLLAWGAWALVTSK